MCFIKTSLLCTILCILNHMEWSEGNMSLKNPVTPPGIDPGTVWLAAQCLNHYATPGPFYTTQNGTNLASNWVSILTLTLCLLSAIFMADLLFLWCHSCCLYWFVLCKNNWRWSVSGSNIYWTVLRNCGWWSLSDGYVYWSVLHNCGWWWSFTDCCCSFCQTKQPETSQ